MLFTRDDVEEGLADLVDELVAVGVTATICVVGGAAISLQMEREALTNDVDALQLGDDGVAAAIAKVARARQWPPTWLNDAANMWASHYDSADDWELKIEGNGVSILVARPPLLLAMKLQAGRGRRDAQDIELLLDACGIETLDAAVSIFEQYYPTETIALKAISQLRERFG